MARWLIVGFVASTLFLGACERRSDQPASPTDGTRSPTDGTRLPTAVPPLDAGRPTGLTPMPRQDLDSTPPADTDENTARSASPSREQDSSSSGYNPDTGTPPAEPGNAGSATTAPSDAD